MRSRYVALAGLASVVAVAMGGSAQAGAPMAKARAPGWYRMMLGDFEITALSDGTVQLPIEKALTHTTPAKVAAALANAFLTPPFETSVNGFLVNTGSRLVLIDAGSGDLFGPTLGKLVASLEASGYTPAQVDEVYVTHLDGDHIGNLAIAGKPTFPNAVLRAGKADAEFWFGPAALARANAETNAQDRAEAKVEIESKHALIGLYAAAGKFKPIEGEADLVPGIRAIPAPGHSPGHTIYEVTSKGQTLIVIGDLLHCAAVQFPDPSVTIEYDSDPEAAAASRQKAFAAAARSGAFLAAAHIAFPGIGQIRAEGTARAPSYRFYPVNYSNSAPLGI
jgi:glyoxylase-like metal-dependent hydrolase (beta-lactamase superfamily II)